MNAYASASPPHIGPLTYILKTSSPDLTVAIFTLPMLNNKKKNIDIALFSYIIISVLRPKSAISRSPAKGGAGASGGKEDDEIC